MEFERADGAKRAGPAERLRCPAARLCPVSRPAPRAWRKRARNLCQAEWPRELAFESFVTSERHLAESRTGGFITTHEAPIVRFDRDERAALRPLTVRALPRREHRLRRRAAHDALVDVGTVHDSLWRSCSAARSVLDLVRRSRRNEHVFRIRTR
jgi:hypothetical protein